MKILGIRPPEHSAFVDHVQWTGENRFLSPPEIADLIAKAEAKPLQPGSIGNGSNNAGSINPEYRSVETTPILDADWLYERILSRVEGSNRQYYRFHLSGLAEPAQYLRYELKEGVPPGHYNWHQDFGGGRYATRKLSLVIQLSSPSDYDGCELQYVSNNIWTCNYKQPGDAIMFPSWTPHRVTEITRGIRRSLVCWIHGPQLQ